MKRCLFYWIGAPALLLLLAGCAAQAGPRFYAPVPPPPVRAEFYGVAPGPGFVWVPGYWAWRPRGYAWVNGYWARPPRGRSGWAPGRWQPRGRGYYYHRGYWR